jgi:hypothetical protein
MRTAILVFLATSVTVFGSPIGLTGGSTSVTFNAGTMTFGADPITGTFDVLSVPVTWDVSGTTFSYNGEGLITSNNAQTFSLSGDGGADTIAGTVDLASVVNMSSDSDAAVITGTLQVSSVSFADTILDQALFAALTAEDGGVPVTAEETFGFVIGVSGCKAGTLSSPCIISADPVGTASSISLTPEATTATPEPETIGLLCGGLGVLLFFKRRFASRVI